MNYSLHNICKGAAGRAESGAAAAFAIRGGYTFPQTRVGAFQADKPGVSGDSSHIRCDESLRLFHPST